MSLANDQWIRPYGLVMNGVLERGLEFVLVEGVIQEIRASSKPSEPFVVSPAFVNAHSHLEYRGMLDQIDHPEYYEWIYELTRLKQLEPPESVFEQCDLAARENVQAGVAWIGEHSDRAGSADAMVNNGLGGWIFQEVITSGSQDIKSTLDAIGDKYAQTLHRFPKSSMSPHAYFTVDRQVLNGIGELKQPISIHVAETEHETNFTKYGKGAIAERRNKFGVPFEIYDQTIVEVLNDLKVLRPGTQCVHCCAVDISDIAILASSGVTIAHCPRSNIRLKCPDAPVREFLEAGIVVGLGMDSPASGGKIDMFAEMRSALEVSKRRGKELSGEEVWRMATTEGYKSFGKPKDQPWDIYESSSTPLIKFAIEGAKTTFDLIQNGPQEDISFIQL